MGRRIHTKGHIYNTHTHTHTHTHIHTHTHTYTHIHIHTYSKPAVYLYIFTFTAAPAEVIVYYYIVLLDSLDHSVICQVMLELKLLNEEDLVYYAKLYSDYQKNAFMLDHLLVSDTASIVKFCQLLQNMKCQKELGHMLLNGTS